jgi:hypothetical protein
MPWKRLISSLSHDSMPVVALGLCVSTKFQKSKDLLQQNQQITLNPMFPSRCYSFITCHLFCLPPCLILLASSLLIICQTSIGCSWVIIFRILSGVPSQLILSSSHSFELCPPPPKPQTLEYNWLSLLPPLQFMCSPSLLKSQF